MMCRLILLTFTICFTSNFAPGQTVRHGRLTAPGATYFVEVPYEEVDGKIIIIVQIDGKSHRFFVDTGAPTAISRDIFETTRPALLSKQAVSDINGKVDSLDLVEVSAMKIGRTTFTNVPAFVIDDPALKDCFGVDGFLGSDFLINSSVQFDARQKKIRITDHIGNLETGAAEPQQITLDQQGSPLFTVRMGSGTTEQAVFDTGVDGLYSMSNANMAAYKGLKEFEVVATSFGTHSMGLYGMSDNFKTYRLAIPSLQIGDFLITSLISETHVDQVSRIGSRLLHYGILTVDYSYGKMYFEPIDDKVVSQEKFWGISPSFADGQLIVGEVWDEKLKKRVHAGDQIVAVNGMPSDSIQFCDLINNPPLKGISKATLKVKTRNGRLKTVEIQKQ